jgi:hypothetical protein
LIERQSMGSLLNPGDREEILGRLSRLKPDARPLWGRFTPGAMICHVTTGVGQGLGEVQLDPPSGPFTRWPLNWLAIHVIPFPRNAKAVPDMLTRHATTFDADVSTLRGMIERYANQDPNKEWPESRVFGRISGRSWGVLQYKHLDHHLRQFGL